MGAIVYPVSSIKPILYSQAHRLYLLAYVKSKILILIPPSL